METQSYSRNIASSAPLLLTCFNNSSSSWESALESLLEIENGNSANWQSQVNRNLSISELIDLGNSTTVSDKELVFYIPDRLQSNLNNIINQLATHLPLLMVHKPDSRFIVNMHQIACNDSELENIFEIVDDCDNLQEPKENVTKHNAGKGGRKYIIDKFLNIPLLATVYIKANGYKAQERRRDSTITPWSP